MTMCVGYVRLRIRNRNYFTRFFRLEWVRKILREGCHRHHHDDVIRCLLSAVGCSPLSNSSVKKIMRDERSVYTSLTASGKSGWGRNYSWLESVLALARPQNPNLRNLLSLRGERKNISHKISWSRGFNRSGNV